VNPGAGERRCPPSPPPTPSHVPSESCTGAPGLTSSPSLLSLPGLCERACAGIVLRRFLRALYSSVGCRDRVCVRAGHV
jgi:hypothetical protein